MPISSWMTASRNAPSDAERAIGPSTDIATQWFFDGNVGTRPGERSNITSLLLPGELSAAFESFARKHDATLFGLAVDFLFMAFAPSLWWLFLGRILNGMTAASFSTANAYLADVTKPQDRAKVFGWMSSAFSFGGLVRVVRRNAGDFPQARDFFRRKSARIHRDLVELAVEDGLGGEAGVGRDGGVVRGDALGEHQDVGEAAEGVREDADGAQEHLGVVAGGLARAGACRRAEQGGGGRRAAVSLRVGGARVRARVRGAGWRGPCSCWPCGDAGMRAARESEKSR